MSFSHTLLFFVLLSASACAGQTLDGGSNASGGTTTTPPSTNGGDDSGGQASSGASGTSAIPSTPVSGTIKGKPFAPKSIDLEFSKAQNQWFFAMRNYATDCRTIKTSDKIPEEDGLLVNIGGVQPAAGTFTIEYADGHGATFQVGVFEANSPKKAEADPVQTGTIRFDTWSDKPGTVITGAIKIQNDESNVAGTFTAKICPAH